MYVRTPTPRCEAPPPDRGKDKGKQMYEEKGKINSITTNYINSRG
nr:MAG TPA: hypothetical protein [Caudoviricetes sp.]